MDRRLPMTVLAALCLAVPLRAQTVSVALLEDAGGSEGGELSDALVGGCMELLFDEGLIATNESVGRIDRAGFRSGAPGLNAAREGYVDYVALVWIRYVDTPTDPPERVPESLDWRLLRVRDGTALAEGSSTPPRLESKTGDERRDLLARFGRSLADAWMKALRKERG